MKDYENKRAMDIKKAETEATKLANLTGVNHVIVPVGNSFSVYTEKEYPKGYLKLIEPVIIEPIYNSEQLKDKKQPKKQSNAVSEA